MSIYLAGCNPKSRLEYSSRSPDGRFAVEIRDHRGWAFAKPQLRIVLRSSLSERVLYESEFGGEFHLSFAEVAWTEDSQRFGVFVKNSFGPVVVLGYDLRSDRALTDLGLEDALRKVIQRKYAPRNQELDTLKWAEGEEAQAIFNSSAKTR